MLSKKEKKALEDAEFEALMAGVKIENATKAEEKKEEAPKAGDGNSKNKKKKAKAKAKAEADKKKQEEEKTEQKELTEEERQAAIKAALEKRGAK